MQNLTWSKMLPSEKMETVLSLFQYEFTIVTPSKLSALASLLSKEGYIIPNTLNAHASLIQTLEYIGAIEVRQDPETKIVSARRKDGHK